ncbi:unnamed protein product [Arctia plantaginis]|uniref:Uncharacterized protein n=1 Tax=Arctia plantaginis TaxID=874455 RepID=A0A8S0Z1V6_ARCPL|nr:unnamed protein product [Arctia plantaginis]
MSAAPLRAAATLVLCNRFNTDVTAQTLSTLTCAQSQPPPEDIHKVQRMTNIQPVTLYIYLLVQFVDCLGDFLLLASISRSVDEIAADERAKRSTERPSSARAAPSQAGAHGSLAQRVGAALRHRAAPRQLLRRARELVLVASAHTDSLSVHTTALR